MGEEDGDRNRDRYLMVSSNLNSNTSITGGQSSYCLLSLNTQWNNIGSYELYRQSLAGMLDV